MDDSASPPEGHMTKLYPLKDVEDNTSVDIVAIHGLGTTTPRTWEYRSNTGVVNWLSDSNMLPDVVPSARIYTFSWNARYHTDASVARIEDVSKVLLSNLESQRDKDGTLTRPLIFVASCFGGLVVTKALEIANIPNNQYRPLFLATSGVVFLATPLQGTRASDALQWQTMLAGIFRRSPSQTLLEDLDGSTRALRNTSERFVSMVTERPMQTMTMCFWESKKTPVLKAILPKRTLSFFGRFNGSVKITIVDEDSACLFARPSQALDASHSMMNKFSGPSDANFGLVSHEIRKMVEKAGAIVLAQRTERSFRNEHFMISRRPNTLFTGRESELEKLKQALCPSIWTAAPSAPRVYVIQGMGGAGKSEVALKFANDNRSEFWGIFWIDGRSKTSINDGFSAIARMCKHHDQSLEGSILWLQNLDHSWLLILDNADNKNLDMAQFLPAGVHGSILITTRLTECARHQTAGRDHYERLNQKTAIELLLKGCDIGSSLRDDHEEDARAVVELLGCHALAVIQAGAAISQGLCSLEEYKNVFQKRRQALLECFPGQANSEYGGVYATFEVSATYLEQQDDETAKDALQLLNFYAFIHFSDFPEVAFEEAWKNSRDDDMVSSRLLPDGEEDIGNLSPWHVSHLPAFLRRSIHNTDLDKIRLGKARSLLVSLSLVTFDRVSGMTRMHPVSHFWSRDRLQEPEKCMKARMSCLSMMSLSIKNPYAIETSSLSERLLPHIDFIAHDLIEWSHANRFRFSENDFRIQQCIYRLSYLMYRLRYESALFELLEMIPVQTGEMWIRSKNGQNIQFLHGQSERDFRDTDKAVKLLERLCEACMESLAADDRLVLGSQHALAVAYLDTEDTAKAMALFERIIHIRNETLSPEHPDLLNSRHELARVYLKMERIDKAIALFEEIVTIGKRTRHTAHPDLLTSQHQLACTYREIEETGKAILLLEEVVKIRAKTQRPEHPERLKSQHELACAYLERGETEKAITLLDTVVKIRAKILKAEHPHRLASQYELARAYSNKGEMEKAIALLEIIVEIKVKTLKPEHPDRLSSQHELARAYMKRGETEKAIALLELVVGIEAKILKAEHPDRVVSIQVLAVCYYDARNYGKALELARSIEHVARNRQGRKTADWNKELIGFIVKKMNQKGEH